jgi:hypothetical protein
MLRYAIWASRSAPSRSRHWQRRGKNDFGRPTQVKKLLLRLRSNRLLKSGSHASTLRLGSGRANLSMSGNCLDDFRLFRSS